MFSLHPPKVFDSSHIVLFYRLKKKQSFLTYKFWSSRTRRHRYRIMFPKQNAFQKYRNLQKTVHSIVGLLFSVHQHKPFPFIRSDYDWFCDRDSNMAATSLMEICGENRSRLKWGKSKKYTQKETMHERGVSKDDGKVAGRLVLKLQK